MKLHCISIEIILSIIGAATAIVGLLYKILRNNKPHISLTKCPRLPGERPYLVVKNEGDVVIGRIVIDCPNSNVQLQPFTGNNPFCIERLGIHESIDVHYLLCSGNDDRIIRATYRDGLKKKSISIKV